MFRVLDSKGQRVTAALKITNTTDSQTWEGQTNDERFDANDHFGLYLPKDLKALVEATYAGATASQEIVVGQENATVTLKLSMP